MRAPRHLLAGILAFVLALGGTLLAATAPEASPPDGSQDAASLEAAAMREHGLERPEWRPGMAWRVAFPRTDFSCTLVVAQADEGGYLQGSACQGAQRLAAEDAMYRFPFLGRFGPDLQGLEEPERPVRFYAWPLTDGARWRTHWYAGEVEVVAAFAPDVEGPHGPEPGFRLEMHDEEGDRVATYDYVPSLRWWGSFRYANGFRMEVESLDPGWEGEAYVAEAEERLRWAFGFGLGTPVSSFVSREGDDEIHLRRTGGSVNLQRLDVRAPDGRALYSASFVPLFGTQTAIAYLPAQPGTWRLEAPRAGTDPVEIEVHALRYTRLQVT